MRGGRASQRQALGDQRGEPAAAAHLGDVVVLVDVVDERHARRAQPPPQRREEGDAVDDLEHDVGVAPDAAPARPAPRGRRRSCAPPMRWIVRRSCGRATGSAPG